MESPGEYLKRERELRGITLDRIHEVTRIQKKHLEAIEADDYDILPHPTFVKGFIKSYCRLLGVDENDAALRYDIFMRESGGKDDHAKSRDEDGPDKFAGASGTSRNNRIIAGCVALGIALMVIFYAVSSRETTGPGAVLESAVEPTVTAPADEAAPTASAEPEVRPDEYAAPPPSTAPEKKVSPVRRARKAEKDVVDEAAEPTVPAIVAVPPAAPSLPPPAVVKKTPASAENRHSLTMRADDTVWVQVAIDTGEPFDVMLRRGESLTWTAINEFALVIGNAGGVAVIFDGELIWSR
jgi:cytoskeleton protein RodZ